jgi:hypothetical protein
MNFFIAFAGLGPLVGAVCSLFGTLGVMTTVVVLVLLEREPTNL